MRDASTEQSRLARNPDQIQDILESVYTAERSREYFAAVVGDALDQLAGPKEEEEDVDEEDDDENANGD